MTFVLTLAANASFSLVGYYGATSDLSTFGATVSPDGEPVTVSTTYPQPANTTYTVRALMTGTDELTYSATVGATCCTAIESAVAFFEQPVFGALGSLTGDAGTCSFGE